MVFSSRTFQHLSWGVAFCFICIWSTYLTFENYAEHERQKETYEEQLMVARERLEEVNREANKLRKQRDVTLEAHLRKIRQLEIQKKTLQEELEVMAAEPDTQEVTSVACEVEPPAHNPQSSARQATTSRSRAEHSLDMKKLAQHDNITKFHIISHTHWDREWYLPFEQFRGRLVKLLDDVLDQMDTDPTFQHFHLDGQMIPADDYMEIRPYMKERIHLANLQNKIALGPWFVQPDEFLVTGEGLVRNLMLGIRKAEALGGSSLVGYIPDSFGHIAQLPQMLLGFDIESAVSGRGPGPKQPSELWWQSPDGSRVLFIHLRRWYCNGLDMPRKVNTTALIPWYSKKYKELVSAGTRTSHLLLMNGCDHTAPDAHVGQQIVESNKLFAEHKLPMVAVHSNLDDYVSLVHSEVQRRGIKLDRWPGEMRVAVDHLANTLSTKITQKVMNWRVSTLFEKWMEPLEALAWKIQGRRYDSDRVWYAWKVLMENHPHDSICGCSVSDVHREVDTRFAKARQVGEQLVSTAFASFFRHFVDPLEDSFRRIFVFNPSNFPREREIIYARVEGKLERGLKLQCTDAAGQPVLVQMLEVVMKQWTYELPDGGFRKSVNRALYNVAVEVSVPAHGYGVYTFRWVPVGAMTSANPVLERLIEEAKANEDKQPKEKERKADYHGEGDDDEEELEKSPEPEEAREDRAGGRRKRSLLSMEEETSEAATSPVAPQRKQKIKGSKQASPASPAKAESSAAAQPTKGVEQRFREAVNKPETAASQSRAPATTPGSSAASAAWSVVQQRAAAGTEQPSPEPEPVLPPVMENEHLLVNVLPNGRLSIQHKDSGMVFQHLNKLEDGPDIGDEYVYKRRGNSGLMFASEENTQIVRVRHFATHSVIQTKTDFGPTLEVKTFFLLTKGARRVDVRVEVNNQKGSHRLRVLFQPPFFVKEIYADSQFEVIKRPVSAKYFPQQKYMMVYDDVQRRGLAIANKGLPEYNVEQSNLCLTLLRAVDKLGDWGKFSTPTAQELGVLSLEYSIIPFVNPINIDLFPFAVPDAEARKFNERIVPINVKDYAGYFPEALVDTSFSDLVGLTSEPSLRFIDGLKMPTTPDGLRHLPQDRVGQLMPGSLIEVRPRHLVVSTLKKAEDRESLILRFYSPFETTDTAHVYVSSAIRFAKVYRCELSEQRRGEGPLDVEDLEDGARLIKLVVGPKKIVTLELE